MIERLERPSASPDRRVEVENAERELARGVRELAENLRRGREHLSDDQTVRLGTHTAGLWETLGYKVGTMATGIGGLMILTSAEQYQAGGVGTALAGAALLLLSSLATRQRRVESRRQRENA